MHLDERSLDAVSPTVTRHMDALHRGRPDRQPVQHRRRSMTQDGAIPQLGCRPKHQASMPLFDQLIGIVLVRIGTASYSDKFAATSQASKIVVVIAEVQ